MVKLSKHIVELRRPTVMSLGTPLGFTKHFAIFGVVRQGRVVARGWLSIEQPSMYLPYLNDRNGFAREIAASYY